MSNDARGRPTLPGPVVQERLVICIAACLEAAQACTTCASVCLDQDGIEDLRRCIRLALDCADIGHTTANVLSRFRGGDSSQILPVLQSCRAACALSAGECERHAPNHAHCGVCAEACRNARDACQELIQALE